MENHLTAKYELSDGTKVLMACKRVQITRQGFRIDDGRSLESYRGYRLKGDVADKDVVLAKEIRVYDHSGEIRLQQSWDENDVPDPVHEPRAGYYDPENIGPNGNLVVPDRSKK